jgi:hypothetical protein
MKEALFPTGFHTQFPKLSSTAIQMQQQMHWQEQQKLCRERFDLLAKMFLKSLCFNLRQHYGLGPRQIIQHGVSRALRFFQRPGQSQSRHVLYTELFLQLPPTSLRVKANSPIRLGEQINPPTKPEQRFEAETEPANLIAALRRRVRTQQSIDTFLAQGRARIGNIELRIVKDYFNPIIGGRIIFLLARFQNGIRPILDQLHHLPVAVPAGEHVLLDPVMLPQERRSGLVRLNRAAVESGNDFGNVHGSTFSGSV